MLEPTEQTVVEKSNIPGFPDQQRKLWRRADTGELMKLHDAPPGAMYYATWLEDIECMQKGPDGHVLMVVTPGGAWNTDSQASNCTMKQDTKHRCWCRHGTPPLVTCDKVGLTCAAGAGSIKKGSYHGFLTNGVLRQC